MCPNLKMCNLFQSRGWKIILLVIQYGSIMNYTRCSPFLWLSRLDSAFIILPYELK